MFEVNVRRRLSSSRARPDLLRALTAAPSLAQTFTPAQFGALFGFLVAFRGDLSCVIRSLSRGRSGSADFCPPCSVLCASLLSYLLHSARLRALEGRRSR